ncbi:MAG: response regulator [Prevotellaceae bacterium]|jgi:signal transduction histidine kinase/ligand-binding sensor domain-containing protein/DNA-binding response OmpR family regulator|nr:response regulator [Prevotellaceae bacterium]
MKHFKLVISLLILIGACLSLKAYNIRQINSRDGLSNSAVICLFQDKERYLWVGTYDGLNKYNGADIQIYKPDIKNPNSISGNVIRRIIESKDDYLWIMTKAGLNKYSKRKEKVEACFGEFLEDCSIACDSQGNFFILTQAGLLFYYDFSEQHFKEIAVPHFTPTSSWINLSIDTDNRIWITNNGVSRRYAINCSDANDLHLEWMGNFNHPKAITYIYCDKGVLILIDRAGDLFIVKSDEKIFIKNIRSVITEYGGDITSVLIDDSDIIIGFRTNGVIRLDSHKKYAVEKYPINCGVFSLLKDDVQNILWVGTDGQGVYACAQDGYIFKGINLEELPLKTQRPVRAIFRDHLDYLWLGTKGNGIIRIKNYENTSEYDWRNVTHFSVGNGLSNNAVFAFETSRANNVLWIGSSGPELNYYSYDDNKIHRLKTNSPSPFIEVHDIMEVGDTTLWVSSMFSLFKLSLRKTGNIIEARSLREYDFDIKNKQRFNKIYSIRRENDSILWLAMRGNGAIRFNCKNGTHRLITFDNNGIAPMNDILSIHIDKSRNIWLGSSYGIHNLKELPDGEFQRRNYNENDGLPNNTIHGILESNNGKLWLSSNTGIILFDPAGKTFRNFNQRSGLKVIEFSDNAYYKDEENSKYFFGGIDGVVWIKHEDREKNNFVPPILFTKLRILNEEVNIERFLVNKKGKSFLQLRYDQNFFTVSFSVNDFIQGSNRKFSYILENFSEVWMNTDSGEAQFTKIPPGRYILKANYGNKSEQENRMASLYIEILPPWYLSLYAKLFYFITVLCLLFLVYLYLKKKYERKKMNIAMQLDQKYKEEMYENKLRFFTNITHEFCTPLTLIHTPSERILNYEGSDAFVKKYAHLIKSNTERLNNLIQEIIDFRRMETGNKICKIETCNVNEICGEIMEAFSDLAEENNISFNLAISPDISWNSDRSCITTILNNLISNAFKYTTTNGVINISVYIDGKELIIKVYNSGKGIKKEDIPLLFNRYSVLDNVRQNSIRNLSSRNGLGLAICKSMVDLLKGKIEVESEVDKYAEFIVKLPALDLTNPENRQMEESKIYPENQNPDLKQSGESVADEKSLLQDPDVRPMVLIVDDNEEILWMLKDILSEDYAVVVAKDGNDGFKQLINYMPDLVISDIIMPGQDGISMMKQIKLNPHTMHIPVIIISAKSAVKDKIDGIESGADAYISKPFDTQYLKIVTKQLIEKHKKLKEYYNSSASSFDYMNGQLLSKEDRDFIHSAIYAINTNISDIEFSPEDLADNLRISLRSLYRKFKDLGLLPPKDFIKRQRIEYSAKLLLSTKLTISEIMYNAGFTTRSHFYKEFTKRFNQSPKEYRQKHYE